MVIKFNDGTPPIDVEVLLKAESIMVVRDKEGHFSLVNRAKVDESKEVEVSDESIVCNIKDLEDEE